MYPIIMNLNNKRVLIVGGGEVATKKMKMLLRQNAQIVVVSPTITPTLYTYFVNGEIRWLKRSFEAADTKGAFLVIAATNNRDVNAMVGESCLENQLVNIVDSPVDSDFYNMAYLNRGKLKIAISTEGASPLLAKQIKQDLNNFFDDGYEAYLDFLSAAREKIKLLVNDEERKYLLLQELLEEKFRTNEEEREKFFLDIG
ncbi:NAD(P)-binding protein [Ureibacillus aquaedulcis]|uniref:precorrin-2 dehydrogenase n=1 Tax=Ureibacillus aquaedulcis TaxID=3058421 RepID=A0ABT8GQN7_9BACL|nr:NAD(P)-binding protein [Ureibacillus sp. BA0131]MDN4493730.1 NAD(P)-binding protein [Ureibacillus sp. BA0131]